MWLYLESGHFRPLLTYTQVSTPPVHAAPTLACLADLADPNLQPAPDPVEWAFDTPEHAFPPWVRTRAYAIHWAGLHLERKHTLANGWRDIWRSCIMPRVLPYL